MDLLRSAILDDSYLLDLDARDVRSIFKAALDQVVGRGLIAENRRAEVESMLLEREERSATAIGSAVAVPHVYLDFFSAPVIVFVRLSRPINLGAPDGVPTRFVFVLLGPEDRAAEHLDTLMNIARLMSDNQFRYDAQVARNKRDMLAALDRFDARRVRQKREPELKSAPDALTWTGRFAGGLRADLKRRLPHYASDFREGLTPKSLGPILFLFFACLAPSVTFGGIMADQTGGNIGAVEMIVSTALCGVVYAIFAGQPLNMLGGTGPMLIITSILYSMSRQFDVPFLSAYAWVGLWTCLFLVILALTDASFLMRYFTRFTDEIFAALISMIFIFEALGKIFGDTNSEASSLLTLMLALGTFFIALNLSRFKRSRYLQPKMREFLADFGPTIAIISMASIAFYFYHTVDIEELAVPQTLGTTSGRPWFTNPLDAANWVKLGAAIPALLVAVLVYLDQNITARLVNNKDNRLTKGAGYHLDLAIVGGLIAICSLFGLPWLVAATVRSLNHVRSLATVEEIIGADGTRQERIIKVRENRVTGLSIHLLIGLSLLALPLLKYIPMAVLYGLFLYMGVVSMAGNQFFERLNLWPMDSALYPSNHYTRRVPIWTIHKYTIVQLICLASLGAIRASRFGIIFPVAIAALVPIRFRMQRYFSTQHLLALDAEEVPTEEQDRFQ